MLKKLKKLTTRMIVGANVATIILMLLVGYSDMVSPVSHPLLANIGLLFPVVLFANAAFLVFWLICKWRYSLIPLLGFLFAYVPVRKYMPLNVSREHPAEAIKVLSYNVLAFGDAGQPKDDSNEIVQYLLEVDADIVCLQEAGGEIAEERRIGQLLDSVYQYKEVSTKPSGECIALLSKFPILSSEQIPYESVGNLSVAYRVLIDGDTVLVVNNHLETTGISLHQREQFKDLVKGDLETDTAQQASKLLMVKLGETAQIRAPQAEAVAQYVEAHKQYPVILCGDFNDGPNSYSHRVIADQLVDCYVESGNGPGISYNRSGFYVRIDNIMCSKEWVPYQCRVDSKINASDHFPIMCWLKKR